MFSKESKSDFFAESVLFLVHSSVNNLNELPINTIVDLAIFLSVLLLNAGQERHSIRRNSEKSDKFEANFSDAFVCGREKVTA